MVVDCPCRGKLIITPYFIEKLIAGDDFTYTSCQESHIFDGLYALMAKNMGTTLEVVRELMRKW